MYQGKYAAPKGTPKPKRAAATRRIEDVPLNEPGLSAPAAVVPKSRKEASPAPRKEKTPKQKKRITGGTIAFYAIYALVIVTFFVVVAGALSALEDWLVDYENSQPKYKCQQVFDQYFADPDWGVIYDLANIPGTEYEGKQEFVQYMQEKTGSQALRYVATASGDPLRLCKYIIKAGDTNIGTYTLTTGEHAEYEITQWELGDVEIPIKREKDVTVTLGAGQTAYINGVALTDRHILATTVTMAESYLPEGLHGHSTTTYYLDGLLAKPQVEVKDAAGNVVATTYDEATNAYAAQFDKATFSITEEEKATVIAAAKVLSEFRIEAKSEAALARYFDPNSEYYKATVKQDTWMQGYKRYSFTEPVVSEIYRYSEDFFSAHVEMKLNVTRNNDTVKEWNASGTFFFTKRADGKWMVTNTTNEKVQTELTKVRLTYMVNGEVLTHELVDSNTVQLTPPAVSIPEGKAFDGWFYETTNEQGEPILSLAFTPDPETGLVYLGTGVNLEPMVLHAHFSQLYAGEQP